MVDALNLLTFIGLVNGKTVVLPMTGGGDSVGKVGSGQFVEEKLVFAVRGPRVTLTNLFRVMTLVVYTDF